nr:capsid protein [Cressdnaviricota sp.]UOF78019.1 capsid protein [Cressdnaviricota sp.]UOF78306.1 capsid protein [Cressdnaviricota sp.]UOF79235.1 capsid protein [Cressdnaviricota sp.]UOF82974.1 capsid protein [Cressdnaviricota sp.]
MLRKYGGEYYRKRPAKGRYAARKRTALGRYALGYPGYKSRRLRAIGRQIITYPETKYFDTGINAAVTFGGDAGWTDSEVPCDFYVNTSGTAAAYTDSCLIPTAIGSGYGQVIGGAYKFKKLRIKGMLHIPPAADGADVGLPRIGRLLLIMDTSPCGAQAQGENVLQDIGLSNENIFAFKRMPTTPGRFRVLKDKAIMFNPQAAATDGVNTNSTGFNGVVFKMQYSPKLPLHINIATTSSTPTVASTVSHNIFLLLACSTTGGVAIAVTIAAATRCYYCD